jgi:biopolymer transport protein ExbD
MRHKSFKSPKLFSDFNTPQFACVMAMVLFVLLLTFMVQTTPFHHVSADLPEVSHSVSMPGAVREDVMKVTILRDGSVYFGSDRVAVDDLQEKITERLKDRGVEHKVYIVADMRARWGTLNLCWTESVRQEFFALRSW